MSRATAATLAIVSAAAALSFEELTQADREHTCLAYWIGLCEGRAALTTLRVPEVRSAARALT